MDKFLVIDGNSIVNRAFYGIRALSNAKGIPTNAVYGFLNIFLKQLEELSPQYVAVAFDLKEKTFRHNEYTEYKANRKQMPDDLAVQIPILKEVLSSMNIKIFEKAGYEADDIIGTLSACCKKKQMECFILTGDKDDLQLAGENTKIMLVITKNKSTETTIYTEKEVEETYGLTPDEFIDLKAIMGDKSDNIPGVPGIGEVGAKSLIQQYKSIEYIYENIDSLDIKSSLKEKLIKNKELAFLSKRLSTIINDVPIEFQFEDCKYTPFNEEKLFPVLRELNFNSILTRLQKSRGPIEIKTQTKKANYTVLDGDTVQAFLQKVKSCGFIYEIFVPEGEKIFSAFSVGDGEIFITQDKDTALGVLKSVFEDEALLIIGNNLKDDMVYLHNFGVCPKGKLFDTAIGSYLLYPSKPSYRICENAQNVLGIFISEISDKNTLAQNMEMLLALKPEIEKQICENNMEELFYEIELPLIWVLYEIQIHGFLVDKEKLFEFSNLLNQKIEELTKNIYLLAGSEFNINSPKQLGVVLYETLNLPVIKKTKTAYSTDVEVLNRLKGKHEIIDFLLEYRMLSKLKSTYADGLYNVIDKTDGKIHSKFNQTVTQTGRLSSTEPNLQNIPVKTELGREIRKFFIADPGYVLIDADYSQIELRVLAHISGDENMIRAFKEGIDIHQVTASQVFSVPLSEVTPGMRSSAKAVNFGIVYGISDFGLSQDLKIPKKEAKRYIDTYLEKYPDVKKYMEQVVGQAKKDGYVTTMFGRKRYLPEIMSTNFVTRSFGERMALNTPIQGSAADIIKIAMVRVFKRLKEEDLDSRLILQVHDELIVEARKEDAIHVSKILKQEMENAAALKVPLICDMNTGISWYDAK